MITRLFKIDFLATECRQGNLNILRAASQRVTPKSRLIAIRQPYHVVLNENTSDTLNGRFEPKNLSSFILLNSYEQTGSIDPYYHPYGQATPAEAFQMGHLCCRPLLFSAG